MGVGESLGEMALLAGEPYSTVAVALTDCSLLEITRETLAPLVEKNSDFCNLFSDHLVELKAADQEREAILTAATEAEKHSKEPKSLTQRALCSLKGCIGKS